MRMNKTTETTDVALPSVIPDKLFFRIGEVAELVGVKPYVLRYWETEFPMIRPQKASSGHRVYRRSDVELLLLIKQFLYVERYSIEGARKRIRELRRDGDLKEVALDVEQKLAEEREAQKPEMTTEAKKKLSELSRELRTILKKPVADIFSS